MRHPDIVRTIERYLLVAPDNLARSYPEMRFATLTQPNRRVQGHVTAWIDRKVPARLHLPKQHHLQALTAAARAPQAHGPVFIAVAGHDEIPER